MGDVTVQAGTGATVGAAIGSQLMALLCADDIAPGDGPSYQLCKTILLYHPLGLKIAEAPIAKAQSQKREITVEGAPGCVVEAFEKEWAAIGADRHIRNCAKLARVYGVASLGVGARGRKASTIIKPEEYAKLELFFSVFDPLNTAGSLVTDQDPNSPDFQKHGAISVNGMVWHRSRTVTLMNGEPVYLEYTNSAFGYVGVSVYQRALFPLKSFISSMIADDMVATKLGLLIAKVKPAGAIVDRIMQGFNAIKRMFIKIAMTGNVVSIAPEESIETLNMMNVDGAGKYSRDNIVTNIAIATPMPARWLKEESLAEGFGEGSEDAKAEAAYIDDLRIQLQPLYAFFEPIVQYRAWNEDWYATLQAQMPNEYGKKPYAVAFKEFQNGFRAVWPNVITEPDSEKIKRSDTKAKTLLATTQVLLPTMDPNNKAALVEWLADNLNNEELLVSSPLVLDYLELAEYEPPAPMAAPGEPDAPKPMSNAA